MAWLRFAGLTVLLACTFAACDKNRVYEKNSEVKDYRWDSRDKASFTFEIADTVTLYNLYVNVRHADFYPYSNLWLMARTTFPDGKQTNKRIEIPLASTDGAWYGEGMGDIWDARHLIQQGAYFSKPGKYTIELEQNMRTDPLPGVMAIGLRVENTGVKKS